MKTFYILYDGECGLCRACRDWLARQDAWVEYRFSPYQMAQKDGRFADVAVLNPERELVVVSEAGEVWQGAGAWVMCLWGLRRYRRLAGVLAGPSRMGWARGVVAWLSGHRRQMSRWVGGEGPVCESGCEVSGMTGDQGLEVPEPGVEAAGHGAAGGEREPGAEAGRFHEALSRARLKQDKCRVECGQKRTGLPCQEARLCQEKLSASTSPNTH